MWEKLADTIGKRGSEGGVIQRDEVYDKSCRVTLEKCSDYYAITCGVYGYMVHTVFCDENNYESKYKAMKKELQVFVDHMEEMSDDEQNDYLESFYERY